MYGYMWEKKKKDCGFHHRYVIDGERTQQPAHPCIFPLRSVHLHVLP